MIKIIAIMDIAIGTGGGFDQSLNAIVQMKKISINRFAFEILTTKEANVDFLNRLEIQATSVKITIFDRLLAALSKNWFWRILNTKLKTTGPLEKELIRRKCDVVYFVTPNNLSAMLSKLNYVATLWDLCHRDTPEFPEVREYNTYFIREEFFQSNCGPALLILTESKRLADMASQYYGIERKRFLAMPLSPAPFLDDAHAKDKEIVLKNYGIENDYFLYPAQFWAHKNHIRILQALLELREARDWRPNIIFCGKDQGNLEHIKSFIKRNSLDHQVKILGFVPSEDMRGLYEGAAAVIMPTYFGPTNLPPLEAWSMGIPLIYSSHFSEQAGDAALLVDPDVASEIASAMVLSTRLEKRIQLINAGFRRIADIAHQRRCAEEELCRTLETFAVRRQCWK